ncbi:MAG: hypothetical protein ACRD4I_10695, partial [Candidatus Angelobacter sp.]
MPVLAIFVLFAYATQSRADREDWIQIPQHDLQIKEVPGDPGASAIQLYYADYIDDAAQNEFHHVVIKVLSEKGKKYA